MRRLYWALGLGAIYVAGLVFGVLALVLAPPTPPAIALVEPRPALTQHVLFVIVDGLRYDVATDERRMPRFARAMQAERSAEIYAGRISTTAAAVQSYGTGQRGRVALIVRNINPGPVPYNSWFQNAADRGMTLALAGDHVWAEMYGKAFRDELLNPMGVAMEYDFSAQTFADVRKLAAKSPSLLVAHFVTPDFQGHVHGIQSPAYAQHMRTFDERLFGLLDGLPKAWTVVITSDHGATDSGMHGADAKIQRRSPIFAYGPGIAPKTATEPLETLDQADVAGTLAALLGVPAAAHSTGHLLTDWLAVPDDVRAGYACTDGERVMRLARAQGIKDVAELERRLAARCASPQPAPHFDRLIRPIHMEVEERLASVQDLSSPKTWAFLVVILLSAALVGWLLVGRSVPLALTCGALGLAAIALVAKLDYLPGSWPMRVAGALFVVLNLPSLLFLFAPERFLRLLDERPHVAGAIVPGIFAVTYPSNLQPVAWALCVVAPLAIALAGQPGAWGRWWHWPKGERLVRGFELALIFGFAAALGPGGLPRADNLWMIQHDKATLLLAAALLASGLWVLLRRLPRAGRLLLVFLALALVSLWLRRVAPPWLGRPLMLGLPILGLGLVWRRQVEIGTACVLLGFLWVSRDFEVISVAGGFGVTALLGERLGRLPERFGHARVLVLSGLLFCVLLIVRIGVSNGLNPIGMDFAAGAFGDRNVPAAWITFSLIWKYSVISLALMLAFLRDASGSVVRQVALLIAAIGICRAAVLLGMMQCTPGSVWVLMRVISDLPFAMLFAVAACLLLPWASRLQTEPAVRANSAG